jgi:hypothetical protein
VIVVWSLAGAAAGTLVLSTALRLGSELKLTRMDLPFLVGTMVTEDRERAKLLGWGLHAAAGLGFGLVYAGIFAATGRSGWLFGAALGLLHGLVVGTAVVETLLPFAHRSIGSASTASPGTPVLEPPGLLMLNYGRATPIVTALGHVAYGALVGGLASFAS